MRKLQWISIGIVALGFVVSFLIQPSLPERVAIHWNIRGEADGYSDSGFGSYFVPALSLLMLGLFYFLPMIDPMRKNYAAFQKEYDGLVVAIVGFMAYVHFLTLAINLGYELNIMQYLAPGFAVLFYYLGVVLAKAKQNWFLGFRTPWTLSSELSWKKTHALAAKMFKAAGALALVGIIMPDYGLIASVAVVIGAAVIGFVYSYLVYREDKGKRRAK